MDDKRFTYNRLLELASSSGELPYSLMPRLYGEFYRQKKGVAQIIAACLNGGTDFLLNKAASTRALLQRKTGRNTLPAFLV